MSEYIVEVLLIVVWMIMAFVIYPWIAQSRLKRTLKDEDFMAETMERPAMILAERLAKLMGLNYGRVKANIEKVMANGEADVEDVMELPVGDIMGMQVFQKMLEKKPELAFGWQIIQENPQILEYLLQRSQGNGQGSHRGRTGRQSGRLGLKV